MKSDSMRELCLSMHKSSILGCASSLITHSRKRERVECVCVCVCVCVLSECVILVRCRNTDVDCLVKTGKRQASQGRQGLFVCVWLSPQTHGPPPELNVITLILTRNILL